MNKKNLCEQISFHTDLKPEMVAAVLDSLEEIVIQVLEQGDQLHWGGFLRAWTVLKRPATASGKVRYEDTPYQKIRYRLPCCTFGARVVQPMKKNTFNIAEKPTGVVAKESK